MTSNRQAAPVLLRPLPNAILSNGSVVDRSQKMVWTFEWQAVPNASHYHLFVIGGAATIPMIDLDTISTTRYQRAEAGFILEKFLKGWRWKVRANVNGAWGEWTEYRTFDIKPPKR